MSVNSVSQASNAAMSAQEKLKKSTGLNKDDFLTLFITQLKNQDPTKPQDTSEFIGQLAQLTQVEQAYNTNTNLSNLATAQSNSSVLAAANFISRTATATSDSFTVDVPGPATFMVGGQPTDSEAQVTISDASGAIVRTVTVPLSRGVGQFGWDGRDSSGALVMPGEFTMAVTSGDAATTGHSELVGRVSGVDMEGGSGRIVFDGYSVPLSQITSVRG